MGVASNIIGMSGYNLSEEYVALGYNSSQPIGGGAGIYMIWVSGSELLQAIVKYDGTDCEVETSSPDISATVNLDTKLNIYENGSSLVVQNLLGGSPGTPLTIQVRRFA